jgi:hypothetical protein
MKGRWNEERRKEEGRDNERNEERTKGGIQEGEEEREGATNRGRDDKRYKKFWEELIAYFPSYDTGHIENDASNNSSIVACVFVTTVTFLPSRCPATIGGFYLAVA